MLTTHAKTFARDKPIEVVHEFRLQESATDKKAQAL